MKSPGHPDASVFDPRTPTLKIQQPEKSAAARRMKPPLTRTQGVLLYLASWLPLLALYTPMLRQMGAPSYWAAFLYSGQYLLPGVATGAIAWRLAQRVPWRSLGWRRFVAAELLLVLGFLGVWHAAFYAWLWFGAGREAVQQLAGQVLGWELIQGLIICGLQSAVFHIVRIFAELREKDAAASRAEMQALRGQLDPHFLFNSLHSITALVREDPRRAEDALLQFSALLRRVLNVKRDSTDEIPLADEMRFVDDYLAIERLRLGDRLRVSCEVTDEARACRLPAFSVQPLVENALHHAIAPRRDGGSLTIRGAVRDGRLEIAVADDGPGADPAAVAVAPGVGLSVIRERLRVRHGENATLTIATAPGKGFRAILALPADGPGEEGGAA